MTRFQVGGGQYTAGRGLLALWTGLFVLNLFTSPLRAEDAEAATSPGAGNHHQPAVLKALANCERQSGLQRIRACTAALVLPGLTDPQQTVAHFYRGLARFRLKKFELAINDYSKALVLNPNLAEAYNNRGFTYFTVQRLERAIADFSAALKIKPGHHEALSNRAAALEKLTRFTAAAADYTALIKAFPKQPSYRLARGYALYRSAAPDAAIADFSSYIISRPKDADGPYFRALAYLDKGDATRAIADFDTALQLKPQQVQALASRAYALFKTDATTKAINDLNAAIKLQPDFIYGYQLRAAVWSKRGEHAAAFKDYSQALDIALKKTPIDTAAVSHLYLARAWTNAQMKQFDAAISDAGQAIALDDSNVKALIARGNFYNETRSFEKAAADFSRAIAIEPDNPQTLNSRAWSAFLWARQKPANKALLLAQGLADVNRSLQLQPDSGFARDTRGWIMLALQRPDQALVDFQYALAVKPHSPVTVHTGIGRAHQLNGELDAAQKAFRQALAQKAEIADEIAFQKLAKRQLSKIETAMASVSPQNSARTRSLLQKKQPVKEKQAGQSKSAPKTAEGSNTATATPSFWHWLMESLTPTSLTSKSVYCQGKNGYAKAAC